MDEILYTKRRSKETITIRSFELKKGREEGAETKKLILKSKQKEREREQKKAEKFGKIIKHEKKKR